MTCVCCRHARKHFSQAEGGQLDEVRQVMGMLAFPSDTHISPYKVRILYRSPLSQNERMCRSRVYPKVNSP